MKKPILKTLPNGVRVLMIPQVGAATATALVLVGTGSINESKEENGISHFLEHMLFKGTDRFPTTKSIVEVFERAGAISNAFTGSEYTGYFAKGIARHVPTFLDMLADIYLHSTLPSGELEKERGVIIEEINMYEDMPQQKVGETLIATMFGDQPTGWNIAGPKSNIKRLTRENLIAYHTRQYRADNTLVVVSGDIDPNATFTYVKKLFGVLPSKHSAKKQKVSIRKDGLKLEVVNKPIDQAHIAIGFHGMKFGHKDARALSLLGTILGRGLSSRLAQTLREELGAAYYVGAGNDTHRDYGVFEINAGIDRTRINEIFVHIARILTDLKTTLVEDDELHKAREYTIGMQHLGLESSDDLAGFYGVQVMMGGEVHTPADMEKLYRAVLPGDIRRVARALFTSTNMTIAVVGPYGKRDIDTSPFLAL
jgi:predicted Zn-dependent peptidase